MKNSILEKARWLRDVALATSKNNGARVAREWLKYAAMFVMLFTIGSGNVWGADYSKNESWNFGTSGNANWSGHSSGYCGGCGSKSRTFNVYKTNISNFSAVNFSNHENVSLTIYVKAGTNSGKNSYTVKLIDSSGNQVSTYSITKTSGMGTGSNASSAKESSVTFTPTVAFAGYKVEFQAKGFITQTRYVLTYDDKAGDPKTYHEWDGSKYQTSTENGTTISKAPTALCSVGSPASCGWVTEEYAGKSAPSCQSIGDKWPNGKTDLYAVYYYDAGDGNAYYSTHPTIYNVTYSTTHATLNEDYSHTCTTDILGLASPLYGSYVYAYYTPESGYSLDETCFTFTYTSGGGTFTPSDMSYNSATGELWIDGVDGNITITAVAKTCTKLADATGLAVENPSSSDATKVKFTWTLGAGTSTNAAKQVFTLTKVGGASQSKDLTKTKTSGTVALSGLSDGTYNWSIQAIGDGVSYCDGNVVEGPSFTICTKDVSAVTPTVNATTSITKTGATANWTAVSDADHYTVKVYAGATATGSAVKTYSNVIGTSQAITGLTAGTQYCVTVQAHDACSHDSKIGTGGVFTTDAKVMRNIIWKNNGVELTAAERGSANTSMEVGEKLTAIPTLASGAVGKSCDTEGHPTFVGWTATPWNGEEPTAAGLFTADNLPTMPAGEGPITYHAVWADGSGVFELVTSAPSNWSGTYLIVSGTQAMSSDFYSGTSGEFKASEVTISNNKIECTDDKLIWIVAKNGDNAQYSFKNKSTGTYAKITGTKSTNAALDANAVWFTIENASGNVYNIVSVSNSARCFAYYAGNTSFRTYAKNSYNTGSLYKVSEATSYITSCSCPAYSFHFGTRSQSDWSDKVSYCFQESGDADGNSGVYWYLEDFVLPDKPHYYVGWQGSWNTTEAKSADADFSGLCFGLLRENSCGTNTLGTYSSGNNQGAVGTLRVRSSYTDNNKYIDFIPGGYVLRLSDDNGSSYTSTEFVAASANLTETVWMTDLTTISAALASSGKYFVDLKTSLDHVWAPNISQVIATSNMGYKKVDGSWGTGLSSGMRGKFRIWADNCSKNWNCHFVPYYHLSYDGNGEGATNLPEASDDKSCEGDVAARTVVVSSTVPTRDGYTFVGWNTAANGSGTAKEAGDNVVLTSDVVLYAQWRDLASYTVNFSADNGTVAGGTAQTVYEEGKLTFPNVTSTTCGTFIGWVEAAYDNTAAPSGATFHAAGSQIDVVAELEGKTYYAVYRVATGMATTLTDNLVPSDFKATGTSYEATNNLVKTSSATYEAVTAKGNNAIQINKISDGRGIVSKISGGIFKGITLTTNANHSASRKVYVYGSSSYTAAYADPAAFNTNSEVRGTLLSTLAGDTKTYSTSTDDYEYIAIFADGAAYLDQISLTWYGAPMKYQTSPTCSPMVGVESNFSTFTYAYNAGPSASQSFTVSGSSLGADLVVTAPANYEVCKTADGTYTSTISYTPSDGAVANTTAYIRLAAGLNVGTYNYAAASGLQVTSTGAKTRTAALNGSVTKADCVITFTDFNAVDHYEATLEYGSRVTVSYNYTYNGDGNFSISHSPATGTIDKANKTLTVSTAGIWTLNASATAGTNYSKPSDASAQIRVKCVDTYKDFIHNKTIKAYGSGTAVTDGKMEDWGSGYTVPYIDDNAEETSGSCQQTHYKFMGWVSEDDINIADGTFKTGWTLIQAGTPSKPATTKTYYAVWAKLEE